MSPSSDLPPPEALSAVIAEYLLAVDSGQRPDRQALLDRHPHLAADLETFFRAQEQVEQFCTPLREAPAAADTNERAKAGEETILQQPQVATLSGAVSGVPGYELLAEVGRGGMGVVYKARQVRLNRVVALKMILAGAHAATDDLVRFRTEAEAVAQLPHPNVVQIHEVGEHNGLPFFSLEFCPGGTLAKKLDGTPLPARAAGELVETLARAVHAAHERHILHRDLKPANVLLAEDGTPKIADFGLAKRLDEQGQTASGAIVGTPSYMPPEQASGKGKELGPAADIYALGAILYECLTGRPPFRAATPLDTILHVIAYDPVPPSRLEPKTPRDLETVCLKCLQKDPQRRYSSARELADDLLRFLDGLPIRARPVSRIERTLKWVRRRPGAAALLGGAVVLVLVLVGLGVAYNAELQAHNKQLTETVKAKDEQRIRAERHYARALAAVDQMLTRIGEERLARLPGFEEERRAILEDALRFCQGLLGAEGQTDPGIKRETAGAYRRTGDIKKMLGRHAGAEKDYLAALALYRELASADEEVQHERALVELHLGAVWHDMGRLEAAEKIWNECSTRLEPLAKKYPARIYRNNWLTAMSRLGRHSQETGRSRNAEETLTKAMTEWEDVLRLQPHDSGTLHNLTATSSSLVNLYLATGRLVQAEARCKKTASALLLSKRFYREHPGVVASLAVTLVQLGQVYKHMGRPERVDRMYETALRLLEDLARERPGVPVYREHLAGLHSNRASWFRDAGRLDEVARAHARAIDLSQALVRDHPGIPEYRANLATCWHNHAQFLTATGHPEAAHRLCKKDVELREKLAAQFPTVTSHLEALAGSCNSLAMSHLALGRSAEAEKLLVRARDLHARLVAQHPRQPDYAERLASAHSNLASLYATVKQPADAEKAFQQALKLRERLARNYPGVPEHRHAQGSSLSNLAYLYQMFGRFAEAEKLARRSIILHEALVREHGGLPEYRDSLAMSHGNLGVILITVGRIPEAEASFQKAIELREELVRAYPTVLAYRRDLGREHSNLGALYARMRRPDKAEEPTRRGLELRAQLVREHPTIPAHRLDLTTSQRNMASLLLHRHRPADAEKLMLESLQLVEGLVKEEPAARSYREALEEAHRALAKLYERVGSGEKTEQCYQRALEIGADLLRRHPEVPDYRANLAEAHTGLAMLLRHTARLKEAARHYQAAIDLCEELARAHPGVFEHKLARANSHDGLAMVYNAVGDYPAAEKAHKKALEIIEPEAAAYPRHQIAVSAIRLNLGNVYKNSGRPALAEQSYRLGLKIQQQQLAADPDSAILQHCVATSHMALGLLHQTSGQIAEAETAFRQALRISDPLVKAHPEVIEYALRNAATKLNLGNLLRTKQEFTQAVAAYTGSLAALEGVLSKEPRHGEGRQCQWGAFLGRAIALGRLGRPAEAVKDWDRAIAMADGAMQRKMRLLRTSQVMRLGDHAAATKEAEALLGETVDPLWVLAVELHINGVAAARADKRLSADERDRLAERYAARAVQLLGRLCATPPFRQKLTADELEQAEVFRPLQGRADFRQLVKEVRKRQAEGGK
jgi:tetratricopeptide (TPR) repeat protein/tRNA A-37 threonylcarbamoyl transferase component Bud32